MATASEILNDPAYTNANEATKQAIFDRHVASDSAFVDANPATQAAIRQRFGIGDVSAQQPVAQAVPKMPPEQEPATGLNPVAPMPTALVPPVPEKEASALGQLVGGAKQVASDYKTAIQSLGSQENANQAALAELQREQEIGQEVGHVRGIPEVKKAYGKEGILGATKEIGSQIPGAIAGSGAQMGTTIGGNIIGGLATRNPLGAYAGGFAALYPQFYMQNLASQADQQIEKGEPVNVNRGRAAAAAAVQAGLEEAGTIYAYGKNFLKAAVGKVPVTALEKQVATKSLVESAKSVLASVGKGTLRTAAEESFVNPSQTLLDRWQSGQDLFSKEALEQYGSDVYGSLLQAPLGSAAGFYEVHTARKKLAEAGMDWQGNPIQGPQQQSEGQKAVSDVLGQVSTKPATTETPQPNVVTPEALLTHVETRLKELTEKANGVPAQEIVDENGNKITIPEQGAQPMTPQEIAELKFLQEHQANPEKLAAGYGVTIGKPKVTGSQDVEGALGELEGKGTPKSPLYQPPEEVKPAEPPIETTPPADKPSTTKGELPVGSEVTWTDSDGVQMESTILDSMSKAGITMYKVTTTGTSKDGVWVESSHLQPVEAKPAEPETPETPPTETKVEEPAKEETYVDTSGKENPLPTITSYKAREDADPAKLTDDVINKDKPVYAKINMSELPLLIGKQFIVGENNAPEKHSMTVTSDQSKVQPKTKQSNQITVEFRPDTITGTETGPNQFATSEMTPRSIESITVHNMNNRFRFPQKFWDTLYKHFESVNNRDGSLTYHLRRTKTAEQIQAAKDKVLKEYEDHLNRERGTLKHDEYKVLSSPGLNEFQKTISEFTTVGQALQHVLDALKASEDTTPITRAYIEVINKLLAIEPVVKAHLHTSPDIVHKKGDQINGFYNGRENLIALFASSTLKTFIHEAVHAATVHSIHMGEDTKAIKDLTRLFNKAKSSAVFKQYGHKNLREFVAEAFSNPKFIGHLKFIPSILKEEPKANGWENFKSIIREMFNITDKARNLFDDVIDTSSELFTGKTAKGFAWEENRQDLIDAETEEGSRQVFNYRGEPVDIREWEIPEQGKIASLLSKWFQYFADEDAVLTRIMKTLKSLNRTISDMTDIEKKQELKNSRISAQLMVFANEEVNPIVKQMLGAGVSLEEINKYLLAKHSPAYNERMNNINHSVDRSGNIIPYRLKDRASSMSTQDALDYLNSLTPERKALLENIAKKWYAIRDKTQKLLVESGQETQETIDLWNETYPFYVPLNREQEQQAMPAGLRTGSGTDVRGDFSKRATGSEKQVISIADGLLYQRERAIARAENNEVGKSIYRLFLEHPAPKFAISVNPDAIYDREALIAELQQLGYDNAADVVDNIMAEPKEKYLRKVKPSDFVIDPTTGFPIPNTKEVVDARVSRNARFGDNVLTFKMNGHERYVFFDKKDPNAITMIRTLKQLDAQQLGWFLSGNRFITHYLGQVYTVLNPIFGIANGIKDYPFGMVNLSTTPLRGKQLQVTAKIMPAMLGIISMLRKERAGGGFNESIYKWQRIYSEALDAGFQTSNRYAILHTGEDRTYITNLLDQFKDNNAKQVFRYVINMTYDFSSMIENGVRLAAYQQMREAGHSPQEAASVAKNLTINFDKKGSRTTVLRSLYLFFNASIQGTVRLSKTLNGPSGGRILAGGILLGIMQAVMIAAAGFKDDDPPEYIRSHNLIIPTGDGKYKTIPMPYGLNILPNTGRILMEAAMDIDKHHGLKNAHIGKHALDWTNALFSTFSPFGNQGLSMNSLIPTSMSAPFAISPQGTNTNAFGQTISKKDSYKRPTPGYMRTKESGSAWGKEFARWMNKLTLGTDYTKGGWSPTGDDIDFLASTYLGPVLGSIHKTYEYAKAKASGEEVPAYKVPVLGRFEGEINTKPVITSRFYTNLNAMYEHEFTLKNLRGNPQATAQYYKDHPEARIWKMAEGFDAKINQINAVKKQQEMNHAPKEVLQRLDNLKIIQMNKFNDIVEKIMNQ